ncbi:PREDICTED: uncharacterized protein LOC106746420 isoform X2 [Dinoponera quadriceps]|uniref:Uncharacterized protein LOC106746420 isoform X2 n=1 Tax=Dinoponera quadriceps TaxID=609295 RepID=A0A6P3XJU6_DINQU|nr:PREDICTED: uncharacterized protein LOC106746420 isoform X2 [Dinoponera quadriceps]
MTNWQRDGVWHNGPWRDGSRRDGSRRDESRHDGSRRDGSSRDGSSCKESKGCRCCKNDQSVMISHLKNKVEHLERGLDWLREQITEKRHEDSQRDGSTRDESRCKESRSVTDTYCKNDQLMQLKNKVEHLERRLDWLRQQIMEKNYEELKRKKILDYEKQRTETMKSRSRQAPPFDNLNKSSCKPPSYHQHTEGKWKLETMDRSEFMSSPEPEVMFKKFAYDSLTLLGFQVPDD